MKRIRAGALLICLSLILVSLTSCDSTSSKETRRSRDRRNRSTEEAETEETQSEETAPVTDVTETETEVTEPTVEPTFDTSDEDPGDLRYEIYMEFCKGYSEIDRNYLFGFSENYGTSPMTFNVLMYEPDFKTLNTYYYDDYNSFDLIDSELITEDTEYKIKNLLPYEEFSKFPCMISEDEFWEPIVFADKIEDGRYFGDSIAFSNDGTKAFLLLGEGIIYTEEEFNNLKVGDKIKIDFYETEYATVTEVNDSDEAYDRVKFDIDYIWFDKGVYTENKTDYILMSDSENPVYTNTRLVILDIAPDVKVTDRYSWLMGDGYEDAQAQFIEDNGYTNPLQMTPFWYYSSIYEFRRESSNGWSPMFGLIYPVVIENGEIASINIEWR